MTTLTYSYGLPASGKTTWARELVRTNTSIVRANLDDIRLLLDGPQAKFSKAREKKAVLVQNAMIEAALLAGHDVVCDDTNLNPAAQQRLATIAARGGAATIVRKDFSDVPPWVCVERDFSRERRVGAKVIWDMWERYLKPEHPGDSGLPHAVLFDLDGTLALHDNRRGPFEWHRVGEDDINPLVVKLAELFALDHTILVVSGRDAVCRSETIKWLNDNNIHFDALYMRPEGDTRKDYVVKLEILEEIKTKYFPALCVDDRQQVVDAYRSVGLPVWQVARGDF